MRRKSSNNVRTKRERKKQSRSTQKLFSNHTHFAWRSIHTEFHISLAPHHPPQCSFGNFQCIRKQNTHEQQCETEKKIHTRTILVHVCISMRYFGKIGKIVYRAKLLLSVQFSIFFFSLLFVLAMTFFLWLFHLCVIFFGCCSVSSWILLTRFVRSVVHSVRWLNWIFILPYRFCTHWMRLFGKKFAWFFFFFSSLSLFCSLLWWNIYTILAYFRSPVFHLFFHSFSLRPICC